MSAIDPPVIEITRLRLHAPVGVDAQERALGNDFEISVSITYPPAADAARADSLSLTVNYAEAAGEIRQAMAEGALLVEHSAWRIIERLRHRWPQASAIAVSISKLAPPVEGVSCRGMGVSLRWSR